MELLLLLPPLLLSLLFLLCRQLLVGTEMLLLALVERLEQEGEGVPEEE